MRIIVQNAPGRSVAHITQALPQAIIVTDREQSARRCFIRTLEAAQGQAHVHLEDDVEISSQFADIINAGIAYAPESLVSFFHIRRTAQPQIWRPGSMFRMAQCFYLPAGFTRELLIFARTWDHATNPNDPDMIVADFMASRKMKWLTWHPCAVQHLPVQSVIDRRRSKHRQTKFFQP